MDGPDHYREAERLVSLAQNEVPDDEPAQAALNARAQVHATLALAAATALQIRGADAAGWEAVALAGKDGETPVTAAEMTIEQP